LVSYAIFLLNYLIGTDGPWPAILPTLVPTWDKNPTTIAASSCDNRRADKKES
jgi:hypothetical protein